MNFAIGRLFESPKNDQKARFSKFLGGGGPELAVTLLDS